MNIILAMAVFWTGYGVAGLFGFQVIPGRYRGKVWTQKFVRFRGLSWIMLGTPWLALYVIIRGRNMDGRITVFLFAMCSLPSLIYTAVNERKYRLLLKNE